MWRALVLVGVLAAPAAADDLDEKLRHCPNTVEGAKTELKDVPTGIELTITSDVAANAVEIRRRAKHMAEFALTNGKTVVPHGKGKGGGWMRNCPVVSKDTKVTASDVERGAKIRLEPRAPVTVDDLRKEARRRYAELPR